MLRDVLGREVLVASNVALAGGCILELIVLCLEQTFSLFDLDVKLDPLLVRGVTDSLGGDAGVLEPGVDGVYSMPKRGELG